VGFYSNAIHRLADINKKKGESRNNIIDFPADSNRWMLSEATQYKAKRRDRSPFSFLFLCPPLFSPSWKETSFERAVALA